MRYIFVLHTGQEPVVAGLPFFIVVGVAFCISRFCLHLRQYASIRCTSLSCLAVALQPLRYRSTFVEPGFGVRAQPEANPYLPTAAGHIR